MRFKRNFVSLAVLGLAAGVANASIIGASISVVQTGSSGTVVVSDTGAAGDLGSLMSRAVNQAGIDALGADATAVAEVTDTLALGSEIGGIGVSVTEAIGVDAAAGAIAACAASVVCLPVAAGVAAVAAAAYIYCDSTGKCTADAGMPQQDAQVSLWDYEGDAKHGQYGSAAAACQGFALDLTAAGSSSWTGDVVPDGSGGQKCRVTNQYGPQLYAGVSSSSQHQLQCAPLPDGTVPQGFNNAAGSKVCPGGLKGGGPSDVAKQIANNLANNAAAAKAVGDALGNGVEIQGTPVKVTGPSSSPGGSTTTSHTNPDGTTSTVTDTQTNHYDYPKPDTVQVTHTTVETTNVTDANGNPVSSGTTTTTSSGGSTGTGTGTGSGTGNDAKPIDICVEHPGILACDTLGVPPADAPTWSNRNITFTPEDLGMPSGCPAPRTFTVRSIVFTLNYQPACDIAPMVSPALVAFAALGCALWIIGQVKG